MLWERGRRSANIEDRRGMGGGPGMGGGIPIGRAGSVGGLGAVALIILALVLGVDPREIFEGGSEPQTTSYDGPRPASPDEEQLQQFVSVVLADTEDTWHEIFAQMGRTYEEPKLVLFDGTTQSGCGFAQAATGPFYCPEDHKVYLDLEFFRELSQRFRAPGDFAGAYVVAHEVGHHVQNLLGIAQKVRAFQRDNDEVAGNRASVLLELQADCLAGVWANHADRSRHIVEAGDVDKALQAASAIGDDRLQREAGRRVSPDSFTHGTSEQRVRWFKTGNKSGDPNDCNTFNSR